MTRQDFDKIFRPMCQALAVKVTTVQAQYFFDEFQNADVSDFAHACRELAMGNPGYLPKLEFFRANVLTAKEMRLEGEKAKREGQAKKWVQAPQEAKSPLDTQFARCCHALINKDPSLAVPYCEAQLRDKDFLDWLGSWRTLSGEVALVWLKGQIELRRGKEGQLVAQEM